MDGQQARGVLGKLLAIPTVMVLAIAHFGMTMAMSDLGDCGVTRLPPVLVALIYFFWPFLAWVVFLVLTAIFDDGPVPMIGTLAVGAAFLVTEIWFSVSWYGALGSRFGQAYQFAGSSFCQFYGSLF